MGKTILDTNYLNKDSFNMELVKKLGIKLNKTDREQSWEEFSCPFGNKIWRY